MPVACEIFFFKTGVYENYLRNIWYTLQTGKWLPFIALSFQAIGVVYGWASLLIEKHKVLPQGEQLGGTVLSLHAVADLLLIHLWARTWSIWEPIMSASTFVFAAEILEPHSSMFSHQVRIYSFCPVPVRHRRTLSARSLVQGMLSRMQQALPPVLKDF